ncbi:tripartite tricarboxylate transporter substrate binding protein [Candidimonas sp. SYP-B2681]|uniref:Bug family tripartite tricarboxylate transporter substrate binding protein n=1 Tax=Candidimonas sp. SYP-B2681 TaxID=2497686 RepID=UPI001F330793|nr:tripartite tricarboxylate transporter substrate binding protein [Candidimonas sp. SYP-B2681]
MKHLNIVKHTVIALAALTSTSSAFAQAYPSKTITMIVPYTAGGSADAIGRNLALALAKRLNTSVVVENKPGAGASLGSDLVAKSAPDGYTILLASTSALTIYPHIAKAKYQPLEDFIPLASVAIAPVALAGTKSLQAQDFKALIAAANSKPDSIRYGTPGMGTVAHLGMEILSGNTNAKLLHVPYKGNSQALTDAIGGSFELLVTNADVVLPHAKTGALRPLAVMAPTRLEAWPQVPTLAELGYPDAQYYSDFGLFLPARTPAATVDTLLKAINESTSQPEFAEFLRNTANQAGVGAGAAYAEKIKQQYERNAGVIKKANIVAN